MFYFFGQYILLPLHVSGTQNSLHRTIGIILTNLTFNLYKNFVFVFFLTLYLSLTLTIPLIAMVLWNVAFKIPAQCLHYKFMYKSGRGWDVQPPRKLIPKFSICAQRTNEEYHSILFYGGTRDFASEFFMFAFVLPRYVNNDQTSISVGYKLYTYHICTSGF